MTSCKPVSCSGRTLHRGVSKYGNAALLRLSVISICQNGTKGELRQTNAPRFNVIMLQVPLPAERNYVLDCRPRIGCREWVERNQSCGDRPPQEGLTGAYIVTSPRYFPPSGAHFAGANPTFRFPTSISFSLPLCRRVIYFR